MFPIALQRVNLGRVPDKISIGWLGAGTMEPYGGAIEAWGVGADFGNVKNNRPELMERVGLL